jgi:hypothetical protein
MKLGPLSIIWRRPPTDRGRASKDGPVSGNAYVQLEAGLDKSTIDVINRFAGAKPPTRKAELYREMRDALPLYDAIINMWKLLVGSVTFEADSDRLLRVLNEFWGGVPVGARIAKTTTHMKYGAWSYFSELLDGAFEQGMGWGERIVGPGGKGGILWLKVADPMSLDLRKGDQRGEVELVQWVENKFEPVEIKNPNLIDVLGVRFEHGWPWGVPLGRGLFLQVQAIIAGEAANRKRAMRVLNPSPLGVAELHESSGTSREAAQETINTTLKTMMAGDERGRPAPGAIAVEGKFNLEYLGAQEALGDPDLILQPHLRAVLAKGTLPEWMVQQKHLGTTERLSGEQRQILEAAVESVRQCMSPLMLRMVRQHLALLGMATEDWEMKWDRVTLGGDVERARADESRARAYLNRMQAIQIRTDLGLIDGQTATEEAEEASKSGARIAEGRKVELVTPPARKIVTAKRAPAIISETKATRRQWRERMVIRRQAEEASLLSELYKVRDKFTDKLVRGLGLEMTGKAPAVAAWRAESGLTEADMRAVQEAIDWMEEQFLGVGARGMAGPYSLATGWQMSGMEIGGEEGRRILQMMGATTSIAPLRVSMENEYLRPLRKWAWEWMKKDPDGFLATHRHVIHRVLEDSVERGMYPLDVAKRLWSVMQGKDLEEAIAAGKIKGAYSLRWPWERMARTEIAASLDAGMVAAWAEDGIEWETIEGAANACEICGDYIGRFYKLGEGPRIGYDTHPNCRCSRVPVLIEPHKLSDPVKHSVPWLDEKGLDNTLRAAVSLVYAGGALEEVTCSC